MSEPIDMGTIINPICSCNEPFEGLFLGGGMMDFQENCHVPYFCDFCGRITTRNGLKKYHRCGICKNKLKMIGEFIPSNNVPEEELDSPKYIFTWNITSSDFNKTYVLEDRFYTCPKCKSHNLKFVEGGCWD